MNKAVFIDKDGTLIKDVPYNVNPDIIELAPFAGKALFYLKSLGFMLVLISNQSGVARGYFKVEDLDNVSKKLNELLGSYNVEIDAFYYCPFFKGGIVEQYSQHENCRKPSPEMILQAAEEHAIDLSSSWMIGDILHDVEAGKRAGCKTILINNGNETDWQMNELRKPDFVVKDLNQAALVIAC